MQAISTIFILVWLGSIIWGVVALFRRKWKALRNCALVFVVSLIGGGLTAPRDSASSSTAGASSSQRAASVPDRTEEPAPPPNPKAEEFARLDSSITAGQIAGNAKKYVGKVVKLRCEVSNVVEGVGANATCGPKEADPSELMKQSGNVNYADPDAVNHALAQQQKAMNDMASAQTKRGQLVLVGDLVKDLDAHQVISFLGTVKAPTEGQNLMGGNTTFPTVSIDFKL
jgi:hypothetical protein